MTSVAQVACTRLGLLGLSSLAFIWVWAVAEGKIGFFSAPGQGEGTEQLLGLGLLQLRWHSRTEGLVPSAGCVQEPGQEERGAAWMNVVVL